jgi:hypothetical protein
MEHFMGSATTSASATFVEQLYARFLHRSADAAGVQYWASEIDSGARNAAQVSAEFFKSAEFQQIVDPVIRLYFTAFGRIPDAAGVDYWAKVMQQGLSIKQVVNHFGNDAEFQSLYGTVGDAAFLDNLYHNAFGRAADSVGKQFFLDQLSHGASRADVVLQFSSSAEMYAVRGTEVKAVEQFIAVNDAAPTAAQLQSALATIDPIKLLTKLYGAANYTGAEVPGLSTSGVAVDGYIKGATVTMTIHETVNGVDIVRTVTRVTDDRGNFDFGDDAGFGALTMTGGTDIATGAPVNGTYTAVAGATVINPLTTLIQSLVEQGQDAAAAEALVKGKLGLDAALDLNNFDAIAAATATGATTAAQTAALKAQAVLAQVNTLMGQVGAALSGVGVEGGANGGANAAVDALATLLSKEGNIDLGAAATAAQLLKDAATAAQATTAQNTAITQIADNAGTAIANLNKAIADAAASSGTVLENLIKIVTVQVASENIEQQMSNGAKAGNVTGALSNTTGSNLNNALDNAGTQIGDVDGNGAGDYTPPPAPEPDPTPPAPAFRTTLANGVVSFSGTTTGDITMRALADGKAVFARGGVEDTAHAVSLYGNALTLNLAANQKLALTEAQAYSNDMAQVEVTGAGKLALQLGYLDDTALARLHPSSILLDGSGEGSSIYDDSYIPKNTAIVLDDAFVYGSAAGMAGRNISGDGEVQIYGEGIETADLSGIQISNVTYEGSNSNLLFQTTFHADTYYVSSSIAMTAAQANGSTIRAAEGGFSLAILGSDGAQTIDTRYASSAYVEGGAGADTIRLGEGQETIAIAFAGTGAKLEQKVTLGGTYAAGDKIYLYAGDSTVVYTIQASDLSGAAPLATLADKLSAALNAGIAGHVMQATAGTGANAGTITLVSNEPGRYLEFEYDFERASGTQTDTFTLGGRYEVGDQIKVVDTELGLDFMFTVESHDLGQYGSMYGTERARLKVTERLASEINSHLGQADRTSIEHAQYVDGKLVFEYDGAHTLQLTALDGTRATAVAGQWTLPLTAAALNNEFQVYFSMGGRGHSFTHTVTAEEMVGDPVANVAAKLAQLIAATTSDLGAPVVTASADANGLITITALHAGTANELHVNLGNITTSTYTNTNELVDAKDATGWDDTQAITKDAVPSTVASDSTPELPVSTVHEATAGVESSLAAMDTIDGFDMAQDRIEIHTANFDLGYVNQVTRVANIATSENLETALSTAFTAIGAHQAGVVVIDAGTAAGTYLYVNDATAAFSATNDVFIKLTGVLGLGSVGVIDNFFYGPT